MGRAAIAIALLAGLSGCASMQGLFPGGKAQSQLLDGLRLYDAGKYEASRSSLLSALETGGLSNIERADAHKHLAFIHCGSNRMAACRDEARKALAADPKLQLNAAEAGHPTWGPIFAALNGSSVLATGLKQYDDGNYAESAKSLQGAIDLGLPDRERANAHKHLAFIHCGSNRVPACRDEFRKALAADPELSLEPAEAGHPVWGPVFRSAKATR